MILALEMFSDDMKCPCGNLQQNKGEMRSEPKKLEKTGDVNFIVFIVVVTVDENNLFGGSECEIKRKRSRSPRTEDGGNHTTSQEQEENQQKKEKMRGRQSENSSKESWENFKKNMASRIKDKREAKAMRYK